MVNPFEAPVSSAKPTGESAKPTAGLQDPSDIRSIFDDDSGDVDDKPEAKEEKKPKVENKEDDTDDGDDKSDSDDNDKEEADEDEEDGLKLNEDDESDEDDEKLDLKKEDEEVINVPPKKKEILAKYPKFFEEFPAVEKIIYRDKQYSEMFGSFDNAKDIHAKSEQFNEFESQLLSGNINDVLKVVKATDSKAYDKIVDNYLNVLEKNDPEAFRDVTGNYFKRVIQGMVNEAGETNNKELHESAKELYKYLFNTTKWEDPKARVNDVETDKDKELKAKEEQFNNKQLQSAANSLQTKVDNVLRSTIADHIDPTGLMSKFEKKKAIDDCLSMLHSENGKDKVLVQNLSKLWKAAQAADFSNNSLESIRKTYLGKSRLTLQNLIKKVRNEVLGDRPRRKVKDESDDSIKEDTAPRQSKTNVGRPSQQKSKANERQKGESIDEYFARD